MPHAHNELTHTIQREIHAAGPMSFARFMELALYHPVHGYYRQQPLKQIGCQGDFYTSPAVGSLFGQLLAFQCADWLHTLLAHAEADCAAGGGDSVQPSTARAPLQLVEAGGAHDGRLALDILSWFQQQRPDLLEQIEYWIIEPFLDRRRRQSELLHAFAGRLRWFGCWDELPLRGVRGVILSNELLDSFPVSRLGWDAPSKAWFEWFVDWSGRQFRWRRTGGSRSPEIERELNTPFWRTLPAALLALLPDGFTVEICPAARSWWSQAAMNLRAGKLLSFDYGLESHEFLAPHRRLGTLRSYRTHRPTPDPLAQPGEQDLTAHVNFSALIEAGEGAGLKTDGLYWQAAFLTRLALEGLKNRSRFGPWTERQTAQLQTLVHPDHMGHSFRVLVQSRSPES